MTIDISERAFEDAIERALLRHGPDARPGSAAQVGEQPRPSYGFRFATGGYRKRAAEDYDRALCLLPRDVFDFLLATQPKEWPASFPSTGASSAVPATRPCRRSGRGHPAARVWARPDLTPAPPRRPRCCASPC